jgi:DDE superfamily endonuclease
MICLDLVDLHPQRVSVWGMVCSRGVGDIHLFEENLDAKLMKKILTHHLVQSCNRVFIETEHWKFIWDNDPKHTSRSIKEWMHNKGVQLMDFPPYSPDLNPIENLWKDIKYRVGQRHARDIEELQTYIEEEWNATSEDFLANLVESMPRRLDAVIEKQGGFTKY